MCQAASRAGPSPSTKRDALGARAAGPRAAWREPWKRRGPRPFGLGPGGLRARPSGQANDVLGLRSAIARLQIEFHLLAFVKRSKTVALDRRMVNVDLLLTLRRNEAISALTAEPLDGATGH